MTAEKTEIIGLTEFKRNMERWTRKANDEGVELVVCKRNRPWVRVLPASEGTALAESTKSTIRQVEL